MPRNRVPPSLPPPTPDEQRADAYSRRVLSRSGVPRDQWPCPRAKSDMTPCLGRDGALALAYDGTRPLCVGCDEGLVPLVAREEAGPPAAAAPDYPRLIAAARTSMGVLRDHTRRLGEMPFRERDAHVLAICAALDALAALTDPPATAPPSPPAACGGARRPGDTYDDPNVF